MKIPDDHTARIMDGVAVARDLKEDIRRRVEALREQGMACGLATILVGDDPASQSYVGGKHRDCAEVGIDSIRIDLPATSTQEQLEEAILSLNNDPRCTGFIVQLPLPRGCDEQRALSLIDPLKDADGLHPVNLGKLVLGAPAPLPCTPRGVVEMLRAYEVPLDGAEVVVVGRGTTIGRPISLLLTRRSENATVTICHTGTRDLSAHTRQADIIVAGAGAPGLITADMIRPGAVCVGVGITRTPHGLASDFDDSVWYKASLVAPVPGGVGPMTRAMLLANVVERAEDMAR